MEDAIITKIVWALDPLGDQATIAQSLLALGPLARGAGARIEPVFVMSPSVSLVSEIPFSRSEDAFQALAEKEFASLKLNCDLQTLAPLKILVNPEWSKGRDAALLLNYAKEAGADLIAVSTHARKGFPRLILGSFAETLFLRSMVPVLTINPETKVRENIRRILLPTDFRRRFSGPFEQAVKLARAFDADLTLYYKDVGPRPGFMNPEVREYLAKERHGARGRAEEWRASALGKGVRAEVIFDQSPAEVSEGILAAASDLNCDIIVAANQADPLSAMVMGSVVRTLVRHAPCPVYIYHVE